MQSLIKPRVLIVHHTLWSHYKNGLYKYLLDHNTELDIKILQVSSIEGTREGMANTMVSDYAYTLLFDTVLEKVPKWNAFLKIKAEIDHFKPTVVNVNGFFASYHFFTMLYCRIKGIKIILSNDSTAIDNKANILKYLVKKTIISLPHGFFCFGKKAAEYMKMHGALENEILAENMAVVDNDFIRKEANKYDREAVKRKYNIRSTKVLLFVGRFLPIKQLDLLVQSFIDLNKDDWALVLIGDGFEFEKIKKISESNAKIHLIGPKKWFEVPEFYAIADGFVLCSISEPWGLVINEAIACNIPVLVSNKCGSAEDLVIHGQSGLVFNADNKDDFINNLEHLMTTYQEDWIINASQSLERFTFERATKTMSEAFCKLS